MDEKDKRIAELEAALAEVDEIRHRLKEGWGKKYLKREILDLKAPCMVLYRAHTEDRERRARELEEENG